MGGTRRAAKVRGGGQGLDVERSDYVEVRRCPKDDGREFGQEEEMSAFANRMLVATDGSPGFRQRRTDTDYALLRPELGAARRLRRT